MLLHGGKNEDSIKNFFQEVYELYVKVRTPDTLIPAPVHPLMDEHADDGRLNAMHVASIF